jgi:acyl-CoA dehydrogenase
LVAGDERAPSDLVSRATRIAEETAGPAADDVDRKARFPAEAVEAMRAEGLMSALVPENLGGEGRTYSELSEATRALGAHCASAAMVYAMHQLEVACLVRHGKTDLLHDYLRDLVRHQLLLASATTEIGVGGDIRTSVCAMEHDGATFRLEKQAPVISYGENADGVLATARRTPDSAPNDQVLVLCKPPGLKLEITSGWDTLGFRGTCSLGFHLQAEGDERQILADPFGDIASRTMLPVSHVLWSSVWLGLASAAVDRARRFVRAEGRKKPGVTSPAAVRLAELVTVFQQMEAAVRETAKTFDAVSEDSDVLDSMGFALAMNGLKVSASTLVVDIVGRAMTICGMNGYREDSPYSLGRILRDAHGAAVMVSNDRIIANNAQMLLIHKDA